MRSLAILVPLAVAACGEAEPSRAVAYPTAAYDNPFVAPVPQPVPPPPPSRAVVDVSQPPAQASPARGEILVTASRRLGRPTEVVGIIDEHEPSGQQDAAFALLRSRAAAMGADAVLGVEFHHGDEPGETTHLSGLAVRYLDRSP